MASNNTLDKMLVQVVVDAMLPSSRDIKQLEYMGILVAWHYVRYVLDTPYCLHAAERKM
jgi:hypothetical protein